MRIAGSFSRVRPLHEPFRRAQAHGAGRGPRSAGRDGDDALHPVHALHPRDGRGCRHVRTRRHGARRTPADRYVRRQAVDERAFGQRDRRMPGRRADQQAVPVPRACMGTDRPRIDRLPRCTRIQSVAAHAPRRRSARGAAGQRSDQRVLAVGSRPLLLRCAACAGPRDHTDDPPRWRTGGDDLGRGACVRRRSPAQRTRRHRCAGRTDDVQRGRSPAGQAAARPRQRQHRPSPAHAGLFRSAVRAAVRHARRRHREGDRDPPRRLQSAPRDSAAQSPHPQGGEGRRQGVRGQPDRLRIQLRVGRQDHHDAIRHGRCVACARQGRQRRRPPAGIVGPGAGDCRAGCRRSRARLDDGARGCDIVRGDSRRRRRAASVRRLAALRGAIPRASDGFGIRRDSVGGEHAGSRARRRATAVRRQGCGRHAGQRSKAAGHLSRRLAGHVLARSVRRGAQPCRVLRLHWRLRLRRRPAHRARRAADRLAARDRRQLHQPR